jgi:hypothetical protein
MRKRYKLDMVFDVELFLNNNGKIVDFTIHPLNKEIVLI